MECPRCTLPLKKVEFGNFRGRRPSVLVDVCPECQGGWFDKGELGLGPEVVWKEARALDFPSEESHDAPLICPRCFVPLLPITSDARPGLILDRCPDCLGLWLDRGEMGTVQELAAGLESAEGEDPAQGQGAPGRSWFGWLRDRT